MADNGVQSLEGTEARTDDAPPAEQKNTEITPEGGAAPAPTEAGQPPAAEPAMRSEPDTIRSVFVARTAAWSVTVVGGFAEMETVDVGLAVRGAYRAHLSVGEAEAIAGAPAAEGDVLRQAYRARAGAEAAAQPRPKQRTARRATGSVSSPGRKAGAAKAKKRAARAAPAKAKKRSAAAAKAKPRAASRRAAARPARRGKRRRG